MNCPLSRDGNACVVGGGPAGLAAAIALSQAGYRVTVVDQATPPIDKACGEGVLPEAVRALGCLGVTLAGNSGYAFQGIRFIDRKSTVQGSFPTVHARGLSRVNLHNLLVERATELGVQCVWNAKRIELTPSGVGIDKTLVAAGLIVGADGAHSQVRKDAGLHRAVNERRRYGFRRHYLVAPWSDYVEVYWGLKSQVYITPVSREEISVAVVSRHSQYRLKQALEDLPELQERLAENCATDSERGGLSIMRQLRSVHLGNTVLVGDASGSIDVITGEGLGLAFQQALALASSTSLDQYAAAHRRICRRPRRMAELLLLLEAYPYLRKRAFDSLAKNPEIFRSLLAVHVGEYSIQGLASLPWLRFGMGFLSA